MFKFGLEVEEGRKSNCSPAPPANHMTRFCKAAPSVRVTWRPSEDARIMDERALQILLQGRVCLDAHGHVLYDIGVSYGVGGRVDVMNSRASSI